jgi:hypothetical protein
LVLDAVGFSDLAHDLPCREAGDAIHLAPGDRRETANLSLVPSGKLSVMPVIFYRLL